MLMGNWKVEVRRELAVPCGYERHVTFGLARAKPERVGGERRLCQRCCLGNLLDLGGELEHPHSYLSTPSNPAPCRCIGRAGVAASR